MKSKYNLAKQDPKFKTGNRVKILANKNFLSSKYKNNWTREILIIDDVTNFLQLIILLKQWIEKKFLVNFMIKTLKTKV